MARGGKSTVMNFDRFETPKMLSDLLTMADRPTAVCCWNDYYAYVLINACLTAGVRMPEDLAIVGFDGLLETRLPARRLVTVSVPWEDMAADAVRMIVQQIDGLPVAPMNTFPVLLIPGDTA